MTVYPTLAETLGLTTHSAQALSARLQADLATMAAERSAAIDDAVAAHELVDIQREQIAEYQETLDAQRVHIREMEPLANRAAQLAQELAEEGRFCDYFRDEAIVNAAHLAEIDRLLSAVGIDDGPTIERVNMLINLWLHAEARAQGVMTVTHVCGDYSGVTR